MISSEFLDCAVLDKLTSGSCSPLVSNFFVLEKQLLKQSSMYVAFLPIC